MPKTLSVKEYALEQGKTKEAIFYQIKKWNIKATKNFSGEWEIIVEDDENKNELNSSEIETLKNQIELLNQEVNLKDEIIKNKEEVITSQQDTIQAEQRTNMALVKTCEVLEDKEKKLLLENRIIKKDREELAQKSKGFFNRIFGS